MRKHVIGRSSLLAASLFALFISITSTSCSKTDEVQCIDGDFPCTENPASGSFLNPSTQVDERIVPNDTLKVPPLPGIDSTGIIMDDILIL